MASLKDWLADDVRTSMALHCMPAVRSPQPIVWSELGADAAMLGAAGCVAGRLLADPGRLLRGSSRNPGRADARVPDHLSR